MGSFFKNHGIQFLEVLVFHKDIAKNTQNHASTIYYFVPHF